MRFTAASPGAAARARESGATACSNWPALNRATPSEYWTWLNPGSRSAASSKREAARSRPLELGMQDAQVQVGAGHRDGGADGAASIAPRASCGRAASPGPRPAGPARPPRRFRPGSARGSRGCRRHAPRRSARPPRSGWPPPRRGPASAGRGRADSGCCRRALRSDPAPPTSSSARREGDGFGRPIEREQAAPRGSGTRPPADRGGVRRARGAAAPPPAAGLPREPCRGAGSSADRAARARAPAGTRRSPPPSLVTPPSSTATIPR